MRAALNNAADNLAEGETALKDRQYTKSREFFAKATKALAGAEAPMRSDLRAVELTTGLRFTDGGVVTSAVHTTDATVIRWADGDTVVTDRGRVRVLGMNTPELNGRCSPAEAAKQAAEQMAPAGSHIRLVDPVSVQEKDKYGRLLRYVEVSSTVSGKSASIDVGYSLLLNSLAEPRYDSRDGYQWHPRESAYRATKAKAATNAACPANKESAAFVTAAVLAATKGTDEHQRRALMSSLIPSPHLSAAKHLPAHVAAIKRSNEASDRAERARKAKAAAQARRSAQARAARARAAETLAARERAARQRAKTVAASKARSSSHTVKSKSPGTASAGGSYPGYTGPRCYAPGGKTWKPC